MWPSRSETGAEVRGGWGKTKAFVRTRRVSNEAKNLGETLLYIPVRSQLRLRSLLLRSSTPLCSAQDDARGGFRSHSAKISELFYPSTSGKVPRNEADEVKPRLSFALGKKRGYLVSKCPPDPQRRVLYHVTKGDISSLSKERHIESSKARYIEFIFREWISRKWIYRLTEGDWAGVLDCP